MSDRAGGACAAPRVLVIMGVSGAGKSTLGRSLADRLGWPFQEGDALHPAANLAKMAAGQPLDDADRCPWLTAIAAWIDRRAAAGDPGVITCSALRAAYRQRIAGGRPQVVFVNLNGARGLIAERLRQRSGHFMPPALLASQIATLEAPGPGEGVLPVDVALSVGAQVEAVIGALGLEPPPAIA